MDIKPLQPWKAQRKIEADIIRNIRIKMYSLDELPEHLQRKANMITTQEKYNLSNALIVIGAILICTAMLVVGCQNQAHAAEMIEGHTITQWTEAIYMAEGGDKTSYPYGIRSLACETKEECRQICRNTVRNNYKRYKKAVHKNDVKFIEYLALSYAPIGAENDNKNLNQNWIRNVKFFLEKSK